MNTLIVSIKLIAKGEIPSQVELLGEPIYENGKLKSFETIYQDYNYDEENNIDFSIEKFNISVDKYRELTYEFNNYFTFNVLSEGEVEFEFYVLIKNVHEYLINTVDNLITPDTITVNNFTFRDEAYFIESDMNVVEIIECTVDDIC